jgi:hypothetical protein
MGRGTFREALTFVEPLLTRFNLFSFVMNLYDRVCVRIQKVQFFLIKGLVKNTNCSVTTLFIGCEESAYQLAYLAYSEIESFVSLGKFLSCQIDPSHLPEFEIIAVSVKKPLLRRFQERGYLLLPYVSFSLDLRRSIEYILKKSSRRRRRDIKKLESFNYSYTISRDKKKDFDFFYQKMYLPYTQKRFKKAAKFETYLRLSALYRRNGRIIFVRKEGKPIAGILFHMKGETLHALSSGVYEGDHDLVTDLAAQAALLFLIDWSKSKGMKSLDYGSTLPFFSDGIFSYKKEWGMFLEGQPTSLFCALKLSNPNEGALSFLQQNPFIFVDKGAMKGVVFVNHNPTTVELQRIHSKYYVPKLDSLIIVTYHNSNIGVTGETEFSTSIKNPSMKSIQCICSPLRKRGFNIETYTFTDQKNAVNAHVYIPT